MAEQFYATGHRDFQHLLSLGFSDLEAERLIHMKDHVTEQGEYREMLEENRRLEFIRWLIENNRMGK
jgi:hypothetical protein